MASIERYIWKVYVFSRSRYETVISQTEPTTASDGAAIDPNETIKLESLFINLTTPGYINLESTLADNQSIRINASNVAGGIDIDAGIGGISMDTTNTISLNAGAASNFTTTNGNLTLQATAGLVNIDSGSGINIGNGTTTPVLIGTASNVKTVEVGSSFGTSTTSIHAGTYGLFIGNDYNSGGIYIGSLNNDKTINIGNSSIFSRVFLRYGVGGGLIKHQSTAVWIPDSDTTIFTSHLLNGILAGTLTAPRQLLLPTAATLVTSIPGIEIDDAIDFSVINRSSIGSFTVIPGSGGFIDGNAIVDAATDKSGLFRLQVTNIISGTETYTIYRIA